MGVYGFTAEEFFSKLTQYKIDTFLDIRRRRAVRGSEYAFVNSNRLQSTLAEMNIRYRHILELAPTDEIRHIQEKTDKNKTKDNKRSPLNYDN